MEPRIFCILQSIKHLATSHKLLSCLALTGYLSLLLVANYLILSHILIILGPICAEDFLYPAEYQAISDQP